MKLHGQYLRLHSRYGASGEADLTLDELAAALNCTHRNANNIIRSMVQHGWVEWSSRRGRGKRSLLRFQAPPEDIAAQSMLHAMAANRSAIGRSIEQLKEHMQSSALEQHLQGWLLGFFGHRSELRSNKRIDALRLPLRQQLHTVDPLCMNLLAESFVSSHVFDGLVRRSHATGEIAPCLAHAWEVDASRKRWTFYLRKEVLFHNGKVLTADDVVFTLERLIGTTRRTLYSYIFKQIQSVRAVHPTVVVIELNEPNELFLPFLGTSRAAIVPKDLDQLGDHFGTKPIGTGPFQLTEMNDGGCVLEAFTSYYQGRAHLDRVEIVHVPWVVSSDSVEPSSPFHLIHDPSEADNGRLSQIHSQTVVRKFVTCNTQKSKGTMCDPRFRERLLACLCEETDELAVHSAPHADESLDPQTDEPIRIATIEPYRHDAELVAGRLKQRGIACTVETASVEEFKGPIRLEADLIVFSLLRDQDEQLRLFDLYQTMSAHIDPHTRLDIETMLQAVARQPESEQRAALFARMEELLIREHQLFILYERPVQTAYMPSVRGLTFNSQGWVDLRHVWFPPTQFQQYS
ncbi:ABC transporter substrate-binding protein [Paenibacillus sp. NEAU-GSW1]|uniref:ABC transporter substrate-binding protein n=1 Tax=Paenibacillus sp. NEAU-GSW1 TaxID=2682486 RepID=UPI0012E2B6AE|nr:ABC transporter substrate-binding protein [Paenibacillus sp. NEAU-GSW1]MUT66519.1 ABC transporter substrate-binding protein [Paenibacillus sp. NEAU-GSW1]